MESESPHGILLVDKPLEWTSFQVVNKVKFLLRRRYKQKVKIGHAGTLDPLATGLLILCYGKMTKRISEFQDMPKVYSGVFQLGATTPSYDLETEVDQTFETNHITMEELESAAASLTGDILQKPPVFSAKKIEGKRAYELARKGKTPEVRTTVVQVHSFEILDFDGKEVYFRITCGKGTYIRSLAHDFGKKLNSGAYLKVLHRESIGKYKADDASAIDELEAALDEGND